MLHSTLYSLLSAIVNTTLTFMFLLCCVMSIVQCTVMSVLHFMHVLYSNVFDAWVQKKHYFKHSVLYARILTVSTIIFKHLHFSHLYLCYRQVVLITLKEKLCCQSCEVTKADRQKCLKNDQVFVCSPLDMKRKLNLNGFF